MAVGVWEYWKHGMRITVVFEAEPLLDSLPVLDSETTLKTTLLSDWKVCQCHLRRAINALLLVPCHHKDWEYHNSRGKVSPFWSWSEHWACSELCRLGFKRADLCEVGSSGFWTKSYLQWEKRNWETRESKIWSRYKDGESDIAGAIQLWAVQNMLIWKTKNGEIWMNLCAFESEQCMLWPFWASGITLQCQLYKHFSCHCAKS